MRRRVIRVAFALAAAGAVLTPVRVLAQDPDTPPPGVLVLGPVQLTPSLVVKEMGVDNNVFNEPVDPKTDFTVTATPRADLLFRMRRLRVSFGVGSDYVYYHKYTSERGTNGAVATRIELDLGRFRPYLSAQWLNTRTRLNAEVDERARHRDATYGAGFSLLIASRTHLLGNASRGTIAYEPGEVFRGVDLRQSFDGRRDSLDGGIGIDLTPLTRFSVLVAREQQRFDLSPDRNSNTWRVSPILNFSPTGLLTGSASVGYRRFHTLSPTLADYSGLVSAVSIGATIYGRHQLQAIVNRDVQYSYDENTDYYLGTTIGFTWTTLVVGPVDVRGTATRNLMDYRAATSDAGHDTMTTYGGGVGDRFTTRARLGINVDWSHRDSDRSADRGYRNHRIFAGLTWGVSL